MANKVEVDAYLQNALADVNGEYIVELGIGLVAKGLYRMKMNEGAKAAADCAEAASSVTTGMHLDFLRLAAKS